MIGPCGTVPWPIGGVLVVAAVARGDAKKLP